MQQKDKVQRFLKINIPLTAQALSTYLGGKTTSSTIEYQKLLRDRFCLYDDSKTMTPEYRDISQQIELLEQAFISTSKPNTKYYKKDNLSNVS